MRQIGMPLLEPAEIEPKKSLNKVFDEKQILLRIFLSVNGTDARICSFYTSWLCVFMIDSPHEIARPV